MKKSTAPLLSVLFITYKRPQVLEKSFNALKRHLGNIDCEYVVADDGSPKEIRDYIAGMPFDRFVLPDKNSGLGANNNNGLAACSGRYILMVQDDWTATAAFEGIVEKAIRVLDADEDVGIIRFAGGNPEWFPLEVRSVGDIDYFVCDHKGRQYDPAKPVYSDPPHLRRSTIFDPSILGPYKEGCPMEDSEQDYSDRFDAQDKFHIAFMSAVEMPYFINSGIDVSHRTAKFRYKLDNWLRAAALGLGMTSGGTAWRTFRSAWYAIKNVLISARLLK
ncbi:MAG: glycosyltransferase [Formivibrio sp.]|nr:glycosyltransferase [Formivibrio sp.]